MSIGSLLSIARSAIFAHQTAIQVTSQNISNAEVEGYSRQNADIEALPPQWFPQYSVGTGVTVRDITRVRDTLLDATYREQTGSAEGYGMRRDLLEQIESIFGEPSDSGLSSTLNQFWSSWSDLANNPTSETARGVVQQRGTQLAGLINNFAKRLDVLQSSTRDRINNTVEQVNALAKQVAVLNEQIIASESGGHPANDLRDARDRAVDAMAKLVPTRVVEHSDGSAAVLLGSYTLVDGDTVNTIEPKVVAGTPTSYAIGYAKSSTPFTRVGGALGAMLDALNTDIPTVRGQLDTLAAGLVSAVNAQHTQGWTAAGAGVPFFDPAGTTASSIALSSQVKADASVIAAGGTVNATGDNSIALALSRLRDQALASGSLPSGSPLAGTTFNNFYRDLVSRVALDTSSADQSATVYQTLAAQADTRRQSVSGVSTDEEMVSLIKHQAAYSAAARLVKVADEMAQTLVQLGQ
jgi:flagellar hook-associated protein 1 FlgK